MKRYIVIAAAVILAGCKPVQPAVSEAGKPVATEAGAAKIISGHYADKRDFTTLSIKASAKYRDEEQSQSITADIRIRKNEMIFVSIRFLGITMAKALITPTEVKYYEKLNSTYFEGDYAKLSQWLGTELDFNKVQNLLIGQALDDLNKGRYKESVEGNLYKLEETSDRNTQKVFYFDPGDYTVRKEEISQPSQRRSLEVNYPGYTRHAAMALPSRVLLEAVRPKGKTNISIDYNSATFNEPLSFPYSVPEGYERVEIE